MNRAIYAAAFVTGLAVVCWVGAGYIDSGPLALTMTVLIGAVYLAGAVELWRFHRVTVALVRALAAIPANLSHLGEWLGQVPPSLQNPVRLRIEGERVGLPGPVLTPYLVGLLVLLGMLGTFLGMVLTLDGAVTALEGTTDLQAIRSALAAPVKGLGFAFGTSVAGVAASAMLGLISALCRRERLQAAQLLDTQIATTLCDFSYAHRRQQTFDALQLQARVLPDLVDTMQAMMAQVQRQGTESNERLLAEQQRFYRDARGICSELADSVDKSLKASLIDSARLAGETIQPAVAATMAGIARETTALQQRVADAVERQLDGVSERFATSVATVADTWTSALASHERSSERLSGHLQAALAIYADTFAQRSAALHARLAETVEIQLDGLAGRFGNAVTTVADTWTTALASHERASEDLTRQMNESLQAFAGTFDERSAALLASIGETASTLLTSISETATAMQAQSASSDEARQTALTRALEAMAASLRQEWQQAGARSIDQHERILATLGETASDIAASARTQARSTIEEVARLMQTASEAPRAAADVIGQLRQELSASIARDNELLAERSRIMETLGALSAAIGHASNDQRQAIDALVASSTELLERAGNRFTASVEAQSARFTESIEAQSARMAEAAGDISVGAVEIAAVSDAFGLAVKLFGESSDRLSTTLQRIEGALEKSTARSDEQLAYYVAQAREIVDLSIMSQKQVVEDLQRISGKKTALAGEA